MVITKGSFRNNLALILIIVSALILLSLHIYKPPAAGLWLQTFFNSMHVIVFSVVTINLYVASAALAQLSIPRRIMLTGITVIILGALSEAAQIPGPRDASFGDLLSDWYGSIGALLLILASGSVFAAKRKIRISIYITGTAILLSALAPMIFVTGAYVERNLQEPILVSFGSIFNKTFVRTQHSLLTPISRSNGSQTIGRVSLGNGPWPGLIFHDIWPDWRSYSKLIVELSMSEGKPLEINIRVHDREHGMGDQPYDDRFNMTHSMQPGHFTLQIPLEQIRNAPKARKMDLSQIDGIVVFCSSKDAGRVFELVEIRLE